MLIADMTDEQLNEAIIDATVDVWQYEREISVYALEPDAPCYVKAVARLKALHDEEEVRDILDILGLGAKEVARG